MVTRTVTHVNSFVYELELTGFDATGRWPCRFRICPIYSSENQSESSVPSPMNRKPDPLLLARIDRFGWLANCGKPFSCPPELECRQAGCWGSACELNAEQIWEDAELAARNNLTAFLAQRYPTEDRQWNDITDAARKFVDGSFTLRFRGALRRKFGVPPKGVVDSMKWNIIAALMEDAYKDLRPPGFFTKLLSLYESGHLPCGWENGVYPEGRLIVF